MREGREKQRERERGRERERVRERERERERERKREREREVNDSISPTAQFESALLSAFNNRWSVVHDFDRGTQ